MANPEMAMIAPVIITGSLFVAMRPAERLPDGRVRPPSLDWRWFVGSVIALVLLFAFFVEFGGKA